LLAALAVGLLTACQGAPGEVGPPAAAPPSRLLIITLDTFRADRIGSYGYARAATPALDALAAQATRFADVTCAMPTTLPSHLTILTGLTPRQHGVRRNGEVPGGELRSIFHLLKERYGSQHGSQAGPGARTAAVTAARVLDPKYLGGLGLDDLYFGDEEAEGDGAAAEAAQVPAGDVVRRGLRWLDETLAAPSTPEAAQEARQEGDQDGAPPAFALWLHLFDSHEPYDPAPELAARFAAGYAGALPAELPVPFLTGLNDPAEDAKLSAADRRYVSDLYDAEVGEVDAALATLFGELRRRGLWDSLTVVVVGDHGQALGESADGDPPFWGHGERLLGPVIRVPLIIKEAGQRAGRVVATPVETLDLLPTLAELLGLEAPAGLTGRSLVPALHGGTLPALPYRLVERRYYPQQPERQGVALDAGDWKLTAYYEAPDDGAQERALAASYHLGRTDGAGGLDGENLFSRSAPEARLLAAALATLRRQAPLHSPVAAGDDAMLRALGYVN
jgi:arylsulfatase A-like enzyme